MSAIISDRENFIIIDPNSKEVNENGERRIIPKTIEQENLVIFCNLKSYPKQRSNVLQGDTKTGNEIVNVASGQFNLLKPNENKDKFTTDWTDINLNNGQLNGEEALGITSIDITYDTSYVPRVTINMTDVRSQALNSNEEGSPYKTFFSFPYPLFILEVKGYYGKLVKYILHLKKYNSRFNYDTGNFEITCEFVGFTFAVLSDLNIYLGLVAPQMSLKKSGSNEYYNGSKILKDIYDNQISKETNIDKKNNIIGIRDNCPTFYQLIRKSKDLQNFYSDFSLQSPKLYNIKIDLDEYLKNVLDFKTFIVKPDTNSININDKKKFINELQVVKNYPILKINLNDSSSNTIESDKISYLETLNNLEQEASKIYKLNDDEINKNLETAITDFFGFKPTIENIFRIICNSFQVFLDLLSKTSIDAANNSKRKTLYSKEKSKTNNVSKEIENCFPWPYIWDTNGKLTYPGKGNDIFNISDYPEVTFINEYIRAQKYVTDLLETETQESFDIPETNLNFNPIHTIQYIKEKPFQSSYLEDILYEILEHSILASQYKTNSIVSNVAKSDAQNLIENLGTVGSVYDTLLNIKGGEDLVNELKRISGEQTLSGVSNELKKRFKVITLNDLQLFTRVIKVDTAFNTGDFGVGGSLYYWDKNTKQIDNNYYTEIKNTVEKYDNVEYDFINYGYPTLKYDKPTYPTDISFDFLKNIVWVSNVNTNPFENPKWEINNNYFTNQLNDINVLKSSFESFILYLLKQDATNQILLTKETFLMPSDLYNNFNSVYNNNMLFITKLYTVLPTLFVNTFADYTNSISVNGSFNITTSLLKYNDLTFNEPSNNRGFNYNSFLTTTWSSFILNMKSYLESFYNDKKDIYDLGNNNINFDVKLTTTDNIESAKNLYNYITKWVNSGVTICNSNNELENMYINPLKYFTLTATNTFIYDFFNELQRSNKKKLDTSADNKTSQALKESLITDDDIKLSLYLFFKNINDKWIYSDDRNNNIYAFNLTGDKNQSNKDLIDYFYYVDRSNRYIGSEILIDVSILSNYLEKNNGNNSLYSLIGEILSKNEMNFHALTSYISYKNNNNVEDIFDNRLDTIMADSQPAFVCQYVGKPATYQYENENHFPDYLKFNFNDNTFFPNIPIFSEKENIINKAVCFTVDVGIQNQNVFRNIQLDQSEFRETQESLIVIDKLSSRDANKFTETIGNNLFNVYARRSYSCKIECLGNMMIQPTMYFYLRYIPLFNGLYLITKVSHNLQGNTLMTNFEGVRVPAFDFPIPNNFIATLSKNVYSNYQTTVLTSAGENRTNNADWDNKYVEFKTTIITATNAANIIKNITNINQNAQIMFLAIMIAEQGRIEGGVRIIKGFNYNYAGVDLTNNPRIKFNATYMNGFTSALEGGTKKLHQFVSFINDNSFFEWDKTKFINKFKESSNKTVNSLSNPGISKLKIPKEQYNINTIQAAKDYFQLWNGFGTLDILYTKNPNANYDDRLKWMTEKCKDFESIYKEAKKILGY